MTKKGLIIVRSYVDDILDINDDKKEIIVYVGDKRLNIPLELSKMGLDDDMDWEFTVGKDICKLIDNENGTISVKEICAKMHDKRYLLFQL